MTDIRLAHVLDAPELQRLNNLFNDEGCNTLEGIRRSIKNNRQEIVCVAARDNKLVGFCCGQVFSSMCHATANGEVTEFFVQDEYRRQGIGRRLLAFLESELQARGVDNFRLLTGSGNFQARAFYASCGYVETQEMLLEKQGSSIPG